MSTNKSNKPELRFKGFSDDWEQRKLGDIVSSFEYGLNAAAKEYDGKNKYIRITDIDDNTHGFLTDNLTSPDIDLTSADNYKLTEGDILFARTGASVGKSYIYRNSDGLVYYAGFLIRARIKEEYDAEFVFQNTLTDRYNKYIAMTSQRSGQPGVNAQEYPEFEINVPQKEEQTKIGTYFHNLDHLITLHQRKCDNLKIIKKSMLDNLFPKNGEKVPKWRFKGFNNDWEQRKLKDMCTIITKQTGFDYSATIKPSLVTTKENDTYSFIQNKDFKGTNINLDTDFYIPISVAEKYPKITLDQPSLLISISGRIGNVGLYLLNSKAFIGGAVGICKLKNIEDGKTALYELLAPGGQKYFNSLIKASSHANITVEDIRDIEVLLPKDEVEKKKLNSYFFSLDHLITLHQSEVERLKKAKQFFLDKMFI